MKTVRDLSLIIFLTLAYAGCSLDQPIENEQTDPGAIASVLSANEALSTAYSDLPTEHLRLSILAEDFYPLGFAQSDPALLKLYNYQAFDLMLYAQELWESYYKCIMDVNVLLEREQQLRITLADTDNLAQVDYLMGEARCLKAICYLDLLRLFATPYDDHSSTEGIILKNRTKMERLPRSTKAATVAEIQKLLDESAELFWKSSAVTPIHGKGVAFCSDRTVTAIRARLALYMGDYETVLSILPQAPDLPTSMDAEAWATPGDRHSIFALETANTFYNNAFDSSPIPDQIKYAIAKELTCVAPDSRAESYTTYVAPDEILPGKYCQARIQRKEIRRCHIIRPQELLFIRAEALARTGAEITAVSEINRYLTGLNATPIEQPSDREALIMAILREKQREFVGENINFFDIKRTHQPLRRWRLYGSRLSDTIAPDDYRRTLPIPSSEYRTNEHLVQNKGWGTNNNKQ